MNFFPISYIEPVFRPPSEARSLILQVTNGCSYNACTFCEMYTAEQKRFKPKDEATLVAELQKIAATGMSVRRVFLADGDAMVLSFRRLKFILEEIRRYLPQVERVSAYCLPRNLLNKSPEQMLELQALGLGLLYVGTESGDDEVLAKVNKGESFESSRVALQKIKAAGIKSSVMILNGLGGRKYSEQHALNSARLMNLTQPEFVSTLVVTFPLGEERFVAGFEGDYQAMTQSDLFHELRLFVAHLDLENSVFRSDHASNYLVLKGTLGQDKTRLLAQIDMAISQPQRVPLRQEWQRGL